MFQYTITEIDDCNGDSDIEFKLRYDNTVYNAEGTKKFSYREKKKNKKDADEIDIDDFMEVTDISTIKDGCTLYENIRNKYYAHKASESEKKKSAEVIVIHCLRKSVVDVL